MVCGRSTNIGSKGILLLLLKGKWLKYDNKQESCSEKGEG